jgi:hypothetical protein
VCANCVTSFESVLFSGAGLLGAAAQVRTRLGFGRLSPSAQRRTADERTAGFLRELGLDPDEYMVPGLTTAR